MALWPLFYAHVIGFYPGILHARLMIQAFGGAFVTGFLGTAGPRMAGAPKLTPLELGWLVACHAAGAFAHLGHRMIWGDLCFVVLMMSLLVMLGARLAMFRKEPPPPQLLLALTGVLCGAVGAFLLASDWALQSAARYRLAQLLQYQGLLLPPVLGIGSFVFPRMIGKEFGEPRSAAEARLMAVRAALASALIVASFFLEAWGRPEVGLVVRAVVAVCYLWVEIRWRRSPGDAPRGSLTAGLYWALALGLAGFVLSATRYEQHISIEHLLYIGGFGLMMLVVGSRVLFGHSGDLEGFFKRGHRVRFFVFLAVLAATTRAVPAWVPSTTKSHHIYAALTWAMVAIGWLVWHGRRFRARSADD